ncbi:MAG: chromosome segregation protein SMC [Neisseriaceae bacterium]|nr:MAG: chromosome segregation protein SMC [Neisseriaceae bacterium]
MDKNNFIKHITLENYKSIKKLDLELKPLNVLIGSNGAGKSNFISFFNFLQNIIKENLRGYVLDKGGQETFLYYGSKWSKFISAKIKFQTIYKEYDINAWLSYGFTLTLTNENIFRFDTEVMHSDLLPDGIEQLNLNNKSYETKLSDSFISSLNDIENCNLHEFDLLLGDVFYPDVPNIQVFHFHDTSDTSPLKAMVANNDNLFLRADGQNLACMIKLINDKYPKYYKTIIDTIRNVVPDFHDFVIRHDSEFLSLEWYNKNNVDIPWKAYYLSDGSLRFIALAVLLLMPSELQPQVIIIDEPEIGLHPTALNVLSGLIKRASLQRQVIISTQSATLLSQFEPDDVIVVDKKDKYSEFKRLNNHDLAKWLESYTLGELWETNVIGGRP